MVAPENGSKLTGHPNKKSSLTGAFSLAEREGFEPSEPFGSRALQARALGRTMQPLPKRRNYSTS